MLEGRALSPVARFLWGFLGGRKIELKGDRKLDIFVKFNLTSGSRGVRKNKVGVGRRKREVEDARQAFKFKPKFKFRLRLLCFF